MEASLYVYGAIVSEADEYWGSESDFALTEFKKELDSLGSIKNLDIYINCPGGEVFAASTMATLLQRLKDKGTYITSYVDGISASAASFLMMVANEIKLYKNSVVMIHKPMSVAWGNVNDMQKTIDSLNVIEDGVLMPMYMAKAKVTEATIKRWINKEKWFNAIEMAEAFNVTLIESEKLAIANLDKEILKHYKNVPEEIKNILDDVVDESEASEPEVNENDIKARLAFFKCSLIEKNIKEKGEI